MQAGKFILISLLIWVGCKKSPVDPPDDEVRNPRNFTWTRDTLGDGSFQSGFSGIWGSSPSNIYVVGHSSTTWQGKIWRYDGSQWLDVTYAYVQAFQELQGFPFGTVQVIGFGANDIWIVGYRDTSFVSQSTKKGFILHYDGTEPWEGYWLPTAFHHFSVGGTSSSDLWVGGLNGQMFHFDGSMWEERSLNDSISVIGIKAVTNNKVYASGWTHPGGVETVKYYEWNGTQWNLIESRTGSSGMPEAGISFDVVNDELFSTNGPYISRRISQGIWQQLHYATSANLFYVNTSGGYSFAIGKMNSGEEAAFHYNGQNWERIQPLNNPNNVIYRVWSFENETFMTGEEFQPTNTMFPRSFVIRGK